MEKCIGCELCAGVCPADCIYVRGARQPARPPGLARRALRLRLRDQLPALHPLRPVRRGLPDRGHHRVQALRVLLHQPGRRHLHQGRAAGRRRRHAQAAALGGLARGRRPASPRAGCGPPRRRAPPPTRARCSGRASSATACARPRAASRAGATTRPPAPSRSARCSRPTCSTRTSRSSTGACGAASGGPRTARREQAKMEAMRERMKRAARQRKAARSRPGRPDVRLDLLLAHRAPPCPTPSPSPSPRRRDPGRRGRRGHLAQPGARRAHPRHDALRGGRPLRRAGGRLPGRRADHRLRRRHRRPVPVRDHVPRGRPAGERRRRAARGPAPARLRARRRSRWAGCSPWRSAPTGSPAPIGGRPDPGPRAGPTPTSTASSGKSLFTTYLFAFEATAALLVIAVVGAVVLARRATDRSEPTPRPRPTAPSDGRAAPIATTAERGPSEEAVDEPPGSVVPRPGRGALHHRRPRPARPAQRARHVHVHRADAQRRQPHLRHLRPHAQRHRRPGARVLRPRGGGGRGRRRPRDRRGHLPPPRQRHRRRPRTR